MSSLLICLVKLKYQYNSKAGKSFAFLLLKSDDEIGPAAWEAHHLGFG